MSNGIFFIQAYGKKYKILVFLHCDMGTKKLIIIKANEKTSQFWLELNFLGSKYRMLEPKISEQRVAVRPELLKNLLDFPRQNNQTFLAKGVVIRI